MQKGNYDRLFLSWLGRGLAVFAAVLALIFVPAITYADAIVDVPTGGHLIYNGMPTGSTTNPNASFVWPNKDSINNNSARAQYERAKAANQGTSELASARKTINTTFRDTYGATATGKISTTTTLPANNTLANLGGALFAGMVAGQVVNSPDAKIAASELGQGNYGSGSAHAAAAFDVFGIGSGLYGLYDGIREASIKKSAAVIEKAESENSNSVYNPSVKNASILYFNNISVHGSDFGSNSIIEYIYQGSGSLIVSNEGSYYSIIVGREVHRVDISKYPYPPYRPFTISVPNSPDLYKKKLTLEDLYLNQAEITNLLLEALNNNASAVNNNSAVLTNFINQLHAAGSLNGENTKTTVGGTTAQNTFLTSPYTPVGSNQAQQTQFTVAKDGSVTATTIPRPDLAANTSQAPSRAPITAPQANPDTRPVKDGSTQEKPDICAQNPNSLMCAELGSGDYEDPVIPNQEINLDFNPANIFTTDGQCPQPMAISFMGDHQFSYQPMCNFARGARPMMIALGMIIAMGMAYSTVKEL